jgi:hypothetical protein
LRTLKISAFAFPKIFLLRPEDLLTILLTVWYFFNSVVFLAVWFLPLTDHILLSARSIVEAGIPIDKLGGVSIGAFMCALWGAHRDLNVMSARCRGWFTNMCRYVGLLDLTYPITSLFAGNYFNWTLTETFGTELTIEDLWLPFYCVSTDVTLSRERVHLSGREERRKNLFFRTLLLMYLYDSS